MNNNYHRCKQRTYAHFDRPLTNEEASDLIRNPKRVSKHSFWPLVVYPLESIYRESNNLGQRQTVSKKRPIAFAAHSDSHIYSFYASMINDRLETIYSANLLCCNSVLAYRKFSPAKSNINFAQEAFDEIGRLDKCEVIALDVEGFFDNLDSELLKQAWQRLFGFERLPQDHFAVYKACTRSYGILVPTLRDLFRREIPRKRGKAGQRICSPLEFRTKVAPKLEPLQVLVGRIKKSSSFSVQKGIPQGLPISSALANLYMLDIDIILSKSINDLGGSYRRYSDDILLIVPRGQGKAAEGLVMRYLDAVKLNIKESKTQRAVVEGESGSDELKVYSLNKDYKKVNQRTKVSYLGFDFDGVNISVRDSTVSRFLIKSSRAIRRAKIAAKQNGENIKRRQLYARLTSLEYGKAYGDSVYKSNEVLPAGAPRIGFFKYMRRAEKVTESSRIRRQLVQIENTIFRWIDKAEKQLLASK